MTVQYIYCPPSFCSTQHQSLHEEAGRCLPFTVATRDMVGRCAVATRDIQPGELIFRCMDITCWDAYPQRSYDR